MVSSFGSQVLGPKSAGRDRLHSRCRAPRSQAYAGRVTEQFIAGAGFIRVDIPEVEGKGGVTKLLNPEYGIDAFAKLGPSATPTMALAADVLECEPADDDAEVDDDETAPF